jgi:hypothetical protein
MGRRAVGRWWARRREDARRRRWLAAHPGRPVDLLVTHAEVNDRHGTGVLLQRLFPGGQDLGTVRSGDDYDARQEFGAWSARVPQPEPTPEAAARRVGEALAGARVRRVLCVPYRPDDVLTALALRRLHGAPLCTWVMDDRNVEAQAIPDALLGELLSGSSLRLAVSPELREAYQERFGLPFTFVPPLVDPALVLRGPAAPPPREPGGRRGVMIGNVWGQGWLARLAEVVAGSGVELDWYSSAGLRWHALGPEELARAGIHHRSWLPDAGLVARLRQAAFAVLPSGTLDASDDHRAIARFSLPSKAVTFLATAHLPTLVLGAPETAAARFVARAGVGRAAPYQRAAFLAAVDELLRPEVQAALRRRAAALAPLFSAEGAGEWIWRSLREGRAADGRWDALG